MTQPGSQFQELIRAVLQEFALSENEIEIYLAVLAEPEITPFAIAKQTGIARTTVYDALYNLSLKKLISIREPGAYEKQQTRIKANNPSILRQILREREKELNHLDAKVIDILPFLKQNYQREQTNASWEFLPGIEGVKKAFTLDSATFNPRVKVMTNLTPMDAVGRDFTNADVDREIANLKQAEVPMKMLIPLTDWTRGVLGYQYDRNPEYLTAREVRYLEESDWDFQISTSLRADGRVSIINLAGEEIWAAIIYSPALYQSLSVTFDFLWRKAKKIPLRLVEKW